MQPNAGAACGILFAESLMQRAVQGDENNNYNKACGKKKGG